MPGRIVPVAPKFRVFHRRKVHSRPFLELPAAVGTAAGIQVHVIHGIIGTDAIDAGGGDQFVDIGLIRLPEFRVPMAEPFGGVLGQIQGASVTHVQHPPVVEPLASVFPGFCRLPGWAEGRSAVLHDTAHLLHGIIAVNQRNRVVVKKLDTVFVQFLRHGGHIVVKLGKMREKVPAEMGTEKHSSGNTGTGKSLCPGLDFIQIIRIRPV